MGIFSNKNKIKRLNPRSIYTLGEAMELANDSRYEHYEFVPIDSEDIQAGYRPILSEELRSYMNKIKKNRRNEGFDAYVTGDGSYKDISRKVSGNLYNNYQNAKGYQPKEFGIR